MLLFFGLVANAQESHSLDGFGVETNVLTGRIIKHTPKFTAPIPPLSAALDVNCIWQTYGKKDWHKRRNYPVIGLGVTFTEYGNNKIFGQCIGVYTNLQIPVIRRGRVEWTLRLGDGIGYVTRKYSHVKPVDTVNNAIGSDLNDFAIFLTDFRYRVNDHWRLQTGINFTHISNADFHAPNLGVNMAGGHLGVQYFPSTCRPKVIDRELPKLKNRWLAQVRVGIGFNEANATGNPELPTYIVSAYASKRWMGKNKVYGGVDYAYHQSTYAFYKTWGINIGRERATAGDGTFFVGNEFIVGMVGIVTQVGYYYKKTYLKYGNDPLNEKFGGNLYIIKHETGTLKELFISAILTTHSAVAEYAEFGVGVGF
jgi:Lipid A 3-O-deacylase (PagL)